MKIQEALENEKQRIEQSTWNKVFLHKDGNFYHAYNWSAWLIKTVICTEDFQKERGDEKMLSAVHMKTKKSDYVILGFPLNSIGKYIPGYESMETLEDGSMVFTVAVDEEKSYEQLSEDYSSWYNTLPVKLGNESNKNIVGRDNERPVVGRSGVFSILSKVLAYPVESKTPAENIQFISDIKSEIIKLL